MDYIKDIFMGKTDQEHVHARFVKYSKGTFTGPFICVKRAGNTLKVNGSYEYADAMAGVILKGSSGRVSVSGNVYSKSEIKTDLAGKAKKKLGIYVTEIKGDADAGTLLDLYNSSKDATFYVELQSDKARLKSKKKPPKPGSDKDEEFFTATLDAGMADALAKDICFDCAKKDYNEIRISHEFTIRELIVPEQYKNDASKARVYAKRKGTITRKIVVDGVETVSKIDFVV